MILNTSILARLFGALLATLSLPSTFSYAADKSANAHQPLIELYRLGVSGDEAARDRAHDGFQQAVKADSQDPVAMVYLGGTLALKGRDAWVPWTKMKHTERGLDLMSRSITLLQPEHDKILLNGMPLSIEVKSISAITFTAVPGLFNRFDEGYDLLRALVKSEILNDIPFPRKAYIYYYAGTAAEKGDHEQQAIELYQTLLKHVQEGEFADKARQRLVDLTGNS